MTGPDAALGLAELKRLAAVAAVGEVESGMVLGLGSGSTAKLALEELAARIARERLRIVGIPTSENTAMLARSLGIPLTSFAEHREIDLTIDGADQVELGSLNLIKGLGGALLREKIVAAASRRMLVVIDEGKLVDRLGSHTPLPVEIATFGWQTVHDRLAALGGAAVLRTGRDGQAFQTDGGNFIADCTFASGLGDVETLQRSIREIAGAIETGLFVGMATQVLVGTATGVEILERGGH
ncbi:MAG: ribose 5-phosphate isomerase A [Geminicoccaceae bacterium]|jgi:ribose 5-phosphate isomerase A